MPPNQTPVLCKFIDKFYVKEKLELEKKLSYRAQRVAEIFKARKLNPMI